MLLDCVVDLGFGSDKRLYIQPCHKPKLIQGDYIRRVHHGDGQGRAHTAQRQHLVLLGYLQRQQAGDIGIHVEVGEVDAGDAVLLGEHRGERVLGDVAESQQTAAETTPVDQLVFQSLGKLLLRDQALPDKNFAESRHTARGIGRGYFRAFS